MAALVKRRAYVRRPGLSQAAKELNVTLSHLRRVVIGERKTPLLARYRKWTRAPKTTQPTPKRP